MWQLVKKKKKNCCSKIVLIENFENEFKSLNFHDRIIVEIILNMVNDEYNIKEWLIHCRQNE